jgi:hypothetical protein
LRFSSLVLVSLVLAFLEFYVELTWRSWHSDPFCCPGTAFVVASFVARACFPSFVTWTSMAIPVAGCVTLQDHQAVVVLSVTPGQPQPSSRLAGPGHCRAGARPRIQAACTTEVLGCHGVKHSKRATTQPCRAAGGMEPGSFQEIHSQPHPASSGVHAKAAAAACSAGATCILAGKSFRIHL